MSGVEGKLRILHSSLCGEYVAPPSFSIFIFITACVAVVDGQRVTFNNVVDKSVQIKTPEFRMLCLTLRLRRSRRILVGNGRVPLSIGKEREREIF